VADMLLRAHAAVDARDSDAWTPLHLAADNGHKEVVDMLLRAHASVNARDSDGLTPLHLAAYKGHKEVADVLLCAGAMVDALDDDNRTALRVAAKSKHLDVVRLLLEWRAVPHAIRPSLALAGKSTTYKRLRDVFDDTVPKTEQQLKSARAAWLAAADATNTDVVATHPTDQALVALQAANNNFVAAPDGQANEAASHAGGDPLEDFTGPTREAAIEHGGDKADKLRNRTASRRPIPPATDPQPSAGGGGCATPPPPFASPSSVPTATATASHAPLSAGAACSAVTPATLSAPPTVPAAGATAALRPQAAAPRPPNADVFAGARDWTITETADWLVECVARVYDAPRRAELQAIVRATAAEHGVTGESLVSSPNVHKIAVCLLGDWGGRLGVVASVTSFIEKVQLYAV